VSREEQRERRRRRRRGIPCNLRKFVSCGEVPFSLSFHHFHLNFTF